MNGGKRRPKVLISAYACEPGCGSEPEVGWRVALEMARWCEVTVLTRENNRPVIEEGLQRWKGARPDFLYFDLPRPFLWFKRRFGCVGGYYFLWQLAARIMHRDLLARVDLVHHVTFNGVQLPGLWIGSPAPVVLGPLGGGMICPEALLSLLGRSRAAERRRSRLVRHLGWLPWWGRVVGEAAKVLAANRETAELLQRRRTDPVEVLLETAVAPELLADPALRQEPSAPFRLLWLGNLIPRKAPVLALRSFAEALSAGADVSLTIAGAGPEEPRLRREAEELGIADRVAFPGRVNKQDVPALMDRMDGFLFTSVRDTSGNVVLEAMARGLPVIALHHQGVREICSPESALLVEPGGERATVTGFAEAIVRLCVEPGLAGRIGRAAHGRVATELSWRRYGDRMFSVYSEVLNHGK